MAGILAAAQKKRRLSRLKTFLDSLSVTFLAGVVFLAANNSVGASNSQTPDSIRKAAGNEPILLAQNVAPKEEKGGDKAVNVDSKGIILNGCDAVAYFKQGKPLQGNPEIASTYQGVTYLFSSVANKADFEKDPPKYVPQYGGFCAYGVANGVIFPTESADAFTVYKGKLYLGGNQDALKSFKANIDDNIRNGDAYWRELTGS